MMKQEFDLHGMLKRRRMTLQQWIQLQDYPTRQALETSLRVMRVTETVVLEAGAAWDTARSAATSNHAAVIGYDAGFHDFIEREKLSRAGAVESAPKPTKRAVKKTTKIIAETATEIDAESGLPAADKNIDS